LKEQIEQAQQEFIMLKMLVEQPQQEGVSLKEQIEIALKKGELMNGVIGQPQQEGVILM
jgi:hypothetical protein